MNIFLCEHCGFRWRFPAVAGYGGDVSQRLRTSADVNRVMDALPADAVLDLALPDGRRTGMDPADNALFTPKSLGILLERHGFRIARRWGWRSMRVSARRLCSN